jgi:small GTP-binding protein
MPLNCGIVGLPNVGKSTLFNALTKAGAQMANYPFCTIEPNTGIVEVPDHRLDRLAELYQPKRILPTTMEFVDIAGLVKGASQGEGLGNQFLSHIREVDAIVHVVRAFEDDQVTHVHGNKEQAEIASVMEIILAVLKEGKTANKAVLTKEQMKIAKKFNLITIKRVLYVANVMDKELAKKSTPLIEKVKALGQSEGSPVVVLCAKYEEEISGLSRDEKVEFLKEVGETESGLDRLIKASYELLGLCTFLTAGEQEVRAWTTLTGSTGPEAAGVIHSDFEKSYIRAEVMKFDDLDQLGSPAKVKEEGKLRIEGKDYIVSDGDVIYFRIGN